MIAIGKIFLAYIITFATFKAKKWDERAQKRKNIFINVHFTFISGLGGVVCQKSQNRCTLRVHCTGASTTQKRWVLALHIFCRLMLYEFNL